MAWNKNYRNVFLLFVIACVFYVFLFNWSWYLRPKNQKLEKPLIQRELPTTLEINEEFTTIHNCSKQSGNQSTGHTVDFKTNVTYVTTKPKPAGPLREESCDIETTLLYLRTNTSILLDNFTDLLTNVTAIGGTDWTFTNTVPCTLNSSIFNTSEVEQYQTTISCSTDTVSVKKIKMDANSSAQIFPFPDSCLGKAISAFCVDNNPVPNVVHYIWFGSLTFDFIYFVGFYSVHKFQKPCLILLYYEVLPSGQWWKLLRQIVHNIVLVKMTPPATISGKNIQFVQHKADITRLKILKEYGGIYVDTDEYFLRSGNKLRNSKCTMGKAHDKSIGSALIYAEKGSQFIEKWIETYKNYYPSKWGDNSVLMAEKLARTYPYLVRVFEHHCAFYPHGLVLYNQNYKWSHSYALHIYKTGHTEDLKKFNFETVGKLNNTIGAVFRYILFGNKELCSS